MTILVGCKQKKETLVTPWGTVIEESGSRHVTAVPKGSQSYYSLDEIISNGEMIVLTMTGPDTYYDYHGRGLGLQYMMCELFAREIGVTLRVELCKDTMEMVRKLQSGEGDVIAVNIPKSISASQSVKARGKGLLFCGAYDKKRDAQWAVAAGNTTLADSLDRWFKPQMPQRTLAFEDYLLSKPLIHSASYVPLRHYTPKASSYTELFKRYAPIAGVDWRLLAAQCYQESGYDPHARSWAGAMGLMQLMPSTASQLGLSQEDVWHPEKNVAAGARLMGQLLRQYSDIPNYQERINFALASYNAGTGHIRDAMALARKYGEDEMQWFVVSKYLLHLSTPEYYQDPVVKHGYMRGKETVGYVNAIRGRYGG